MDAWRNSLRLHLDDHRYVILLHLGLRDHVYPVVKFSMFLMIDS